MRIFTAIAFAISFLACSHASPPAPPRSALRLPELSCRRLPTELAVPIQTQTERLSICAQLPADRALAANTADDLYTLVFAAEVDGSVRRVSLLGADGRPLGGRMAECFAGVMAQVALPPAVGGSCPASVPIRVARARTLEPAPLVASSRP
jgi:hypothetical protein